MYERAHEHPGEAFETAFDATPRELLIPALRAAYGTACEHHEPSRGGDGQTFGFCLYKYAAFEIARVAGENPELTVTCRNPVFRFAVGPFELACHRVGDSEYDDISNCFPGNDGAVTRMIEEQLWLAHVPRSQGLQEARRVVLAHMGNPDDGLRAVYLCIPERAKDDRIAAWAYTRLVWRADLDVVSPTITSVTERAPDELVEEPVVIRRALKRSDGENT